MLPVSMVALGAARTSSLSFSRKAAVSAPRTAKISPGLVQNWPTPSVMDCARPAAIFSLRSASAPGIPAIAEVLPGYDRPPSWNGFLGPAGMPQPIVQRLYQEMNRVAMQPETVEKLKKATGRT